MIDREHELPLTRQAALLKLSRSGLLLAARPVAPADLAVMRRIDELHLDYPFAGSRMLRDLLRGESVAIGRQRVATLMRRMGIEALYRRPNTSKPSPGHKIYPYLLRGLAVLRPNQVWAMDITYTPMARGVVYLAAVVAWMARGHGATTSSSSGSGVRSIRRGLSASLQQRRRGARLDRLVSGLLQPQASAFEP
jgi:putative transposase